MAIVQISQIQQRRGLQADLPQLASAEFGWSIDQRRLYIGNGTLEEGAPTIGNTEILTQYSQIPGVPQQVTAALIDNTTSNIFSATFGGNQLGVVMVYVIRRDQDVRTGILRISHFGTSTVSFDDEYNETGDVGVTLNVLAAGGVASVQYTTTSTGFDATMNFIVTAPIFS